MQDPTVAELAKMIDHTLLHPTLGDDDLKALCEEARRYDVASVCVKPYMVASAREQLEGSDVRTGTVIGFPHGIQTVATKVFETKEVIGAGAQEVDMVINEARALAEDWDYVTAEVRAVTEAAHAGGATVKVIFETDYVSEDALVKRLCEICTAVGADYVKTSTGFGFSKGEDGRYGYTGATEAHIRLMAESTGPNTRVKASGAIRDLDRLLLMRELGASRVGATATVAMLEAAEERFG